MTNIINQPNKSVLSLTLVRHGETDENVRGIIQGQSGSLLNAVGQQQVETLREVLRGETFDVMIASDLARTMQTAHILNTVLALPLIAEPMLRERDWGTLTGVSVGEARALKEMPDSVETVEAMGERARRFVGKLLADRADQRVLAVTHGLFARCLQAVLLGVTIRDVPPMENAEVRTLLIDEAMNVVGGSLVGEAFATGATDDVSDK